MLVCILTEAGLHLIHTWADCEEVRGIERKQVAERRLSKWIFGERIIELRDTSQGHFKDIFESQNVGQSMNVDSTLLLSVCAPSVLHSHSTGSYRHSPLCLVNCRFICQHGNKRANYGVYLSGHFFENALKK